ncbi:MAG: hypothetical protein IKE22_13400 [Atopobiaceae bacterium]|nr:hypothetical protein [Atopobiaceae bacterium]
MANQKPMGMRIGESVFCAGYLTFAFVAGMRFLSASKGAQPNFASTCAIMTFLLGAGDAFHLVPRIAINMKGETDDPAALDRRAFWLGLGNLISSITMTVFYLLLFEAMVLLQEGSASMYAGQGMVRALLLILAAVRIILCLFPQNRWLTDGDAVWGIRRNIPFVAMGIITILYLGLWYQEWAMAALVALSFACYMGVVLYAHERPMMGMLMIPKTVCYIALIVGLLGRL